MLHLVTGRLGPLLRLLLLVVIIIPLASNLV